MRFILMALFLVQFFGWVDALGTLLVVPSHCFIWDSLGMAHRGVCQILFIYVIICNSD